MLSKVRGDFTPQPISEPRMNLLTHTAFRPQITIKIKNPLARCNQRNPLYYASD